MKLTKIEINNFRSIKSETIEMKHNCLVFVGKNEAGKSNILKAIAGGLSQKAISFTNEDKRDLLDDEKYEGQEYSVDYTFELDDNEIKQGFNNVDLSIKAVKIGNNELSLWDFLKKYFSRIVFSYDFKEMDSSYTYYTLPDYTLLNLVKIKTPIKIEGQQYPVNALISSVGLSDEILQYCTKIEDKSDFEDLCLEFLKKIIAPLVPKVYYWKYSDELLLPDRVPLQTFIEKPESCNPLKNLFELAGINNIKETFADYFARKKDYDLLLERVSNTVTDRIRKAWPDLKKIKIVLTENSSEIRIKVQEKIKQNVSARSDGFKKFVSILCMLASPVSTGKIKNSVIILDEPDDGLYPTGAGYLRDMLIDMAETNIVFYSTHNPCMIDKTLVDRHIIVEKNDDITTLKTDLTDSKFRDDEVLLRAIGMSAFENIKEKNILFEGWTDYKVFNIAINGRKEQFRTVLNKLKAYGNSYGNGTPSLKYFISMIKLLDKQTIVILDADQEGQAKKTSLQKEYPDEIIYTLKDFGDYDGCTLEDFINDNLLQRAIDSIGSEKQIRTRGDAKVMQFLSSLNKDEKQNFKTFIGRNIQLSDIKNEYFEILKRMEEKINEIGL